MPIASSKSQNMLRSYQRRQTLGAMLLLTIAAIAVSSAVANNNRFEATFDERGVTKLTYRGISLVDLAAHQGDPFLVGTYRLGARSLWGEIEHKSTWDSGQQRLTWTWDWGSVQCDFHPELALSRLRMQITVSNRSAEILEGINVYPLGLQFPRLPKGFGASNYPQFRNGLDGVPLLMADYGTASLTVAHVEPTALYVGFSPSGPANHYRLQTGTVNDESEGFLSRAVPLSAPLQPGKTMAFTISLRFADDGANAIQTAADILKVYGAAWPQKLNWPDRRSVGELFLTNSTSQPRKEQDANPRNYTFAKDFNIHTEEGKQKFRDAALRYAVDAVARLKKQNAQGAIVWDLEGQQYPQPDTSYAGDPASLSRLAPEMDAVADEFFRTITNAGLRCGITIRPQRLDFAGTVPRQRMCRPTKRHRFCFRECSIRVDGGGARCSMWIRTAGPTTRPRHLYLPMCCAACPTHW